MRVNKLSEYTSYIEQLPKGFSLSRGQSKDYPLLPSALRKDKDTGNRRFPKRAIRNFLNEFKINSYQYLNAPWDIKNDIEWMLHAQHFGLPTKLLDFTTSHITSLLFAVEKAFQSECENDAVVYFLNPEILNQNNMQESKILNISGHDSINSEDYDGPIVIQGRKINNRVNAQKGMFVLFQEDDNSLEETADDKVLRKIKINGGATKEILSSLFSMGISFTNIYPELASVSKDILLQQDIDDFLREKNDD